MLWKKGVGIMQLVLDLKQNLALKMTQEMQQSLQLEDYLYTKKTLNREIIRVENYLIKQISLNN